MGKARRALAITALVVVGIVFLAVLAVFVTTNTGWGREKVRRFALKMLNGRIHGRAQIGHVGGNLLTGLELADFSIVDSAGAPFLTADTVVTHYALRSLLHQRIYVYDVRLVRPVAILDRPPGGATWNWKRIFASD